MISKPRTSQRSDEIRLRRQNHATQGSKVADRRRRKVDSRVPPPVMARYPAVRKAPLERPAKKKVQRRIDVPLNGHGAEIRLPALPRVRIGWRVVSFFLIVGLGFALYQLWTLPAYRVVDPTISGLRNLTSDEISARLKVKDQQIFALDAVQIRNELVTMFPELSVVQVSLALPNTVAITVTERTPVLVWNQDGRSEFVDAQGLAFPVRREELAVGYPVVAAAGDPPFAAQATPPITTTEATGFGLEAFLVGDAATKNIVSSQTRWLLTPDMVTAVLQMAQQAPLGANLVYHPEHGLGWKDQAGWDVYLGDLQDLALKLNVYQAIVQQLAAEKISPMMISLENVHSPYFVMR